MPGKIIKGIAGFYYVYVRGRGIYECKARGAFRRKKIRPMVGDAVDIEITDPLDAEGNIRAIMDRKSRLIRPAVANVDRALVIFSASQPKPNFNLLDRFLVMMEQAQLPTTILVNKVDLVDEEALERIRGIYAASGYPLHFMSAKEDIGIDEIRRQLSGKTTTVAGPSGVGKSSLINRLQSAAHMQTGRISVKLGRGRHTTRHSELIPLRESPYHRGDPKTGASASSGTCDGSQGQTGQREKEKREDFPVNTHFIEDAARVLAEISPAAMREEIRDMYQGAGGFIVDTPGFSSLYVPDFEKEDLAFFFPEFLPYMSACKFQPCTHIHEPGCAVQSALSDGKISQSRYDSYLQMYTELAERRRY